MLTISAGHFGKGTGAKSYLDEGAEVIHAVAELEKHLVKLGIATNMIIDQQSRNQRSNLAYLVKQHNETTRALDVSIHFNAVDDKRDAPIGTEVLYVNPLVKPLAEKISEAIARAGGFINRGAKQRTDLAFLNGTHKQAILIEICFVNSSVDVALYKRHQAAIFEAIAHVLMVYLQPEVTHIIESVPLRTRVEVIFANKPVVRAQLKQGIADGVFQGVWLGKFDNGKLTLVDYLALTTLQLYKEK